WQQFQQGVNKDLADVLGNFVSRVTKFCRSKFGENVPEGGSYGPAETELIETLNKRVATYYSLMENMEIRKSAQELRGIWVAGNEYLQAQAPWTTIKEDQEQAAAQIRLALNLTALYARLSAPFIPTAAAQLQSTLGLATLDLPEDAASALSEMTAGRGFTVPDNLFAKISDEQRGEWSELFAGHRQ
ncbi:MAG: methionine--tRNA ligase, partial [Paracoccaceae bacterium]